MPNPTKYEPSYSFSGFQEANPSRPLPAQRVDVEFQSVARTTDELIAALGDVRRSDGKLVNGIVTLEALSDDVQGRLGGGGSGGGGPSGPIAIGDVAGLQAELDGLDANVRGVDDELDRLNASRGQARGIATLGTDGKVLTAQLPAVSAPDLTGYQTRSQKGQADGYAGLDPTGKVPLAQLPAITGKDIFASSLGITDDTTAEFDTTAVRQAIADLKAAGGGRLLIDAAVKLNRPLNIENASDIVVEGYGKGSLNIRPHASTGTYTHHCLLILNSTRIAVRNLRLVGNPNLKRETSGMAIFGQVNTHVRVENCHITDFIAGVWLNRQYYAWVADNFISGMYADGIHFAMGGKWCIAKGNHIENLGDDALACTMDKGDSQVSGITPERPQHIMFLGNTVGPSSRIKWGAGVAIYDSDHVTVADNDFFGCGCSGVTTAMHTDEGVKCKFIHIADNRIYQPGQATKLLDQPTQDSTPQFGSGMFIWMAEFVSIVGNRIEQVTTNPSATKAGIMLQEVNQVEVLDNRIRAVSGYGISGWQTITDATIDGNHIENVSANAIDFKTHAGNLTGYLYIGNNKTRRVNGTYAINVATPGNLGLLVVEDNSDANLKTSNVDYTSRGGFVPYLRDNFPAIWYPMAVSWIGANVSVSASRYCIEGSHFVLNVVGNINSNDNVGISIQTPFPADSDRVGFLTAWTAAHNIPFTGRHRPSIPGAYMLVASSGDRGAQGPIGTGEIRVDGRIPIN